MVVYGQKAKKKVTDRKKVCVLHLNNPLCVELYRFGPERRMLVLISHVINCGKRADWELRVNSSLCGTVVGSFLARMWMPWWLFHRPGPLSFFGEQYMDSPISRDLHTSRTESKVTDRKKVQRPPRESYGLKNIVTPICQIPFVFDWVWQHPGRGVWIQTAPTWIHGSLECGSSQRRIHALRSALEWTIFW